MKFKALFVTFNIVLFLSFLIIFLLPFFILDSTFMLDFWGKNWYFGIVFLVILGVVNVMFLTHWKLLVFLENEDWPGLAQYLETSIFEKKRIVSRDVRLLSDSLLLLGDFATLRKLEKFLRASRPSLLPALAARFAAANVLSADYPAVHELSASLSALKPHKREWLSFYDAFARHLEKNPDAAAEGMIPLAVSASEPLVAALSGYLCGTVLSGRKSSKSDELSSAARSAKERITRKFTEKKWGQYVDESKSDMQVVVVGKLLNETGSWLYPKS
jgi:hypothetical protein